ncbi:uncharacterized protein LOC129585487 [Paramacrobiotus metropolitanus]|uniref:uncharacterized protein LOC129585487 n=1 Tax=Paramacrobiotus metropolitanus TaxID=2943436 RepID=UPI00244645F0|nr:uncharacterized protein LOC129585487 [Paramacrobiotus metropolitanus]
MKRQRIGTSSAIPVAPKARPVLKPSTKLNRIQVAAPESMSYRELVKVVGVDPESNPLYWRKAIDHSAETVVFFQVDLRGTVPKMCKSVRICQEEENHQMRLVPSVYIGESLLSATYVQTIIGKRFLTDEDDLMKLLEHAGILHEDAEFFEENAEDGDGDHGEDEAGENEPNEPGPDPKRARVAEKRQVVMEPAQSSGRRRTTRSSAAAATVSLKAAERKLPVNGGRQPVDLSPLLMLGNTGGLLSSGVEKVSLPEDDTAMVTDVDDDGSPGADVNEDNLPLGCDMGHSSDMESEADCGAANSPQSPLSRKETERDDSSDPVQDHATLFPYEIKGTEKKKVELVPNLPGKPIWIEKVLHDRLVTSGRDFEPGKWLKQLLAYLIQGTSDYKGDGLRLLYEKRAQFLAENDKQQPGIKALLGDEFILAAESYFTAAHVKGREEGFKGGMVTAAFNAWKDYHIKAYAKKHNLPW